ncbi:MAG TPA: HEPN domain-containing protein [Flavobacterium sp.]|nr:HEPN domain-containing protein [Flavobacterium sp.]
MTILEQLRKAGISDKNIINTFMFKAGGYSNNEKHSYTFGSSKNPEIFWGEIHFNGKGKLHKIVTGNLLASEKSKLDFVKNALSDIKGNHGYTIQHRILFSRRPLKGKFQWKDDFRIKPCINTSQIGKGLAYGVDNIHLKDTEKHLGPPYPFILEVRTKKSPNYIIEHNRIFEALDLYEWLLGLLIPHLLSYPLNNNYPKWVVLQKDGNLEYHLAKEGFSAHESEIESSDDFSALDIPNVPRYSGNEDYYNHLWIHSSEIELPVEMEHNLNSFDNLPTELKENFKRSLYWFNTGLKLYNNNQLSVIPFVTAIESLNPKPSEQCCPDCKRPLDDGPTELFREFLNKHLLLPKDIDNLKNNIYKLRSDMVHGNFATAADQNFHSIGKFEHHDFIAENFIRRALVNYLCTGSYE